MLKLQLGLALVAVVCGGVGARDVLEARQSGTSMRAGLETLVIGAIFAGLFVASLIWRRRSSR